MSFYYFITAKAKDLTAVAIGERGTVRHTPQGEVCVVRSLVEAQRLARLFRDAGLLR